jgi:REP-associated tyrosine transposase
MDVITKMPNSQKHKRSSIRIKGYDYSQRGVYFVTLCVKKKAHLLGCVEDGALILSEIGKIVEKYWLEIPEHFPGVRLDEYVIMPNHVHGLIEIITDVGADSLVGAENLQPLRNVNRYQQAIPRSLSSIIRGFKIGVTKWCHYHDYNFVWQRNYYDHIVRNEAELNRIRDYILHNPLQWQFDRENPDFIRDRAYDKKWGHFEERIFGEPR